jgi:hypothetical protein
VTATAVGKRTLLRGPTWPPSGLTMPFFPVAEHRPVVLADSPCEAGLPAAGPEYAGMYLHARYFDPTLGTFLSPDPIGVEGGMNAYGYALGNPISGTDRSGLRTVCVMLGTRLNPEKDKLETVCLMYGDDGSDNDNGGDGGKGGGGGGKRCPPGDPNCKTTCDPTKDPSCKPTTCKPGEEGCPLQGPPECKPDDPTCNPVGPSQTSTCRVVTRVLQGNKATVGRQGGIPGMLVSPNTAAVIPSQFGVRSGNALRPHAPYISGTVPIPYRDAGRVLFTGVSDVIGGSLPGEWQGKGYPNVRAALMAENPGMMIIERVTGEADLGVMMLDIEVPAGLVCSPGN